VRIYRALSLGRQTRPNTYGVPSTEYDIQSIPSRRRPRFSQPGDQQPQQERQKRSNGGRTRQKSAQLKVVHHFSRSLSSRILVSFVSAYLKARFHCARVYIGIAPASPSEHSIAFLRTRNLPLLALIPFLPPFPPVFPLLFWFLSFLYFSAWDHAHRACSRRDKKRQARTSPNVVRPACRPPSILAKTLCCITHTVRYEYCVKWPVLPILPSSHQTHSVRERTLDPLLPSCPVLGIPPMEA
jgi:hypothetical protein